MEVLGNFFATIGAIHVNAAITIWSFLVNNIVILLVTILVGYMCFEEIKSYKTEFIQDKRRLM